MSWTRKLNVVRESVATAGVWMSLRYLAIHLLSYDSATDRSFDERYGTDTSGIVEPDELGIANEESRKNAVIYLGTPMWVTHRILSSLPFRPEDRVFMDIGCGKGRVMMVASLYPFKKILGVEISQPLRDIALKNIARFSSPDQKCTNLEIVFQDATTVPFPEGDTVIHLYNPFGPAILQRVLENLKASLEKTPRRVSVIYILPSNPIRKVFADFPFLTLEKDVRLLTSDYSWVLYSNTSEQGQTRASTFGA